MWEVDNIIDTKKSQGKKVLFWVKWKKYDKDKEWYLVANFDHAKEVINNFYSWYPTKPYATIVEMTNNSNWKTQAGFRMSKHQPKLTKKSLNRTLDRKLTARSKEINPTTQSLNHASKVKKIQDWNGTNKGNTARSDWGSKFERFEDWESRIKN